MVRIKPWSRSNPVEKLDPDNGLLFCPNHDKLFDSGYISFDDKGRIIISKMLSKSIRKGLSINSRMRIKVTEGNIEYLKYHRSYVYETGGPTAIEVTDLEKVIDKEYYSCDIKSFSSRGIELTDFTILFDESVKEFQQHPKQGIEEYQYVGSRNSITDPPYMRFEVQGKVLIILFSSKDELRQLDRDIMKLGFVTFDLS